MHGHKQHRVLGLLLVRAREHVPDDCLHGHKQHRVLRLLLVCAWEHLPDDRLWGDDQHRLLPMHRVCGGVLRLHRLHYLDRRCVLPVQVLHRFDLHGFGLHASERHCMHPVFDLPRRHQLHDKVMHEHERHAVHPLHRVRSGVLQLDALYPDQQHCVLPLLHLH